MNDTPCKIGIEVEARSPSEEYWDIHHKNQLPLWECDTDGSLEFRFADPSSTLRDTFYRLTLLQDWMAEHGITQFQRDGTHIHMGIKAWLRKKYPQHTGTGKVDGVSPWFNTLAPRLLHGYLIQRTIPMWDLIPKQRQNICPAYEETRPSLFQIHQHFVEANLEYYDYYAIATCHHDHPTFEWRMFSGTNICSSIKGHVALIVNQLKRAERLMDELDFKKCKREDLLPDSKDLPTKCMFLTKEQCNMHTLRREVKEADFLSEPLLDWMSRTERSVTKHVPFECDLSELNNKPYKYEAPHPLAAAA